MAALLAIAAAARAQSLPGLTITGNAFTYNAPDGLVTGILFKPPGNGPFPGVLISHGRGGSATGFSLAHAQTLVQWGFVCVGPNYTHAGMSSTPDNEGYSPENSRRARRALEILTATPGVDHSRLAAFSYSMGSFLTIGLSGELPTQFRAVAIAAGGTSGTSNVALAAPATQEAQGIRAPFLMLHGTADTTVPPVQSANLQSILDANLVPNRRVLFQGVSHNLLDSTIRRTEAYAIMQAWFVEHGVLGSAGNTPPTIRAPATLTVAAGTISDPIAITIGDGETNPAGLTLQAFSLDSDVSAQPPGGAYLGKLPAGGLALGGTGANRTLTLTPRAGVTGAVDVALVVSEPAGAGQLSAVAFVRVTIAADLPGTDGTARVINLSARANVTATEPLIAGFVVRGTGTRTLLIRGVGPTLARFGLTDALADPRVQLFERQTPMVTNDDWSVGPGAAAIAEAATANGAFALPPASQDAALLVQLGAGEFTAHLQTAGGNGIGLVEIYDVGGQADAQLINLSVRSRAGSGGGALIAGFVLSGPARRAVLIRGIGPTLTAFGVSGALPDPQVGLFAGETMLASNNDWGAFGDGSFLAALTGQAGAFALPANSRDAALAVSLGAGAYSAVVDSAPGTTAGGIALIELYAP